MAAGRAEQGAGPIIRVGDIGHIFSPRMTMWIVQVARDLAGESCPFPLEWASADIPRSLSRKKKR